MRNDEQTVNARLRRGAAHGAIGLEREALGEHTGQSREGDGCVRATGSERFDANRIAIGIEIVMTARRRRKCSRGDGDAARLVDLHDEEIHVEVSASVYDSDLRSKCSYLGRNAFYAVAHE